MTPEDWIELNGVREYGENSPVYLGKRSDKAGLRNVIIATVECGWNSTSVDLLDLLHWLKNNRPDILKEAGI